MSNQSVLFDAPGPGARNRHRLYGLLTVLAAAALLAWIAWKLDSKGQLDAAKWSPFVHGSAWVNYLLLGLWHTILAAVIAIACALVLGILLGLGRMSDRGWIRWPCAVFVEFFRAVPVLLMMYFTFQAYNLYAVFPPDLRPLAATVTGLTFYNGSVIAEVLRSGVASLPQGQREAGLSIGLRGPQVLRMILLPQAFTAMMPVLVSQLVIVLKDSALGAAITYAELLNWSQTLGSAFANTLPALLVAAAMFVLMNYALTKAADALERRLRRRGQAGNAEQMLEEAGAGPDMRFNRETG
ncbi:MAG TPA: amino acid ABC transporter permease [Segeticoccus sp.]|uniref:amino acid ABC transporter permease n=1 Tax=Segeticoccus sp. TaxID=2706531 RepID=UPI002D7FEE26|nr:amino acid ABC transporter permease [Segeticoccus sp.]HET8601647.1 amino acid ABC transporter permease [Segeticoccus sp.]